MPVPKFLKDLAVKAAEDVARGGERQVAKRAARGAAKTGKELVADLWAKGLPPEARGAPSLAVRSAAKPVVRALPAPPKPLALPKPGPGLPEFAAKPRGGNWWPADAGPYTPLSPEQALRENVYLSERFSSDPQDKAFADWFDKAAARYIQRDFATPGDPLRALADQGYIPGVANAAQWSGIAKGDIVGFPLQKLLFDEKTRAAGVRDEALAAMPWVNKLPATDAIYGVWPRERSREVYKHVADEMRNALRPEVSGLPADLAVRPEALSRMSFPQAVERVGHINQWRAKQMEQAQLSALNNPAVQLFKEYPEDNPMGLRWVELRAPELGDELPEGYRIEDDPGAYLNSPGYAVFEGNKQLTSEMDPDRARAFVRNDYYRPRLQEALKYEGDTMGHCVGGYCDDVLSGHSRIFSLRDAKGEPHVTIETSPARVNVMDPGVIPDDVMNRFIDEANATHGEQSGWGYARQNAEQWARENLSLPQDIVQIKGKQNRAPNPEYLPFVQDFVKSGEWGDIGDLGNAGLMRLPNNKFVTRDQWNAALEAPGLSESGRHYVRKLGPKAFDQNQWSPDAWANEIKPFLDRFENFARGGRVRRDLAVKPCSCDTSLAVR